MKNIYEDGNEKANFNSAAGSAGEQTPPPAGAGFFSGSANGQSSAGAGVQLPQLSNEQLAALFGQFLAQLAAAAGQNLNFNAAQQPVQNAGQANNPYAPSSGNDTGKRILFQSEDFEERGPADGGDEELLISENAVDEQRRRSFYDDDELFDTAASSPDSSSVKFSDFGSSFRVAEIDFDSDELPALPEMTQRRSESADEFKIETEELFLSQSEPFKPSSVSPKSGGAEPFGNASDNIFSHEIEELEVDSEPVNTPKKSKTSKKSGKNVSELIRKAVLAVSLAAIVVSSAVLAREYKLHKDNESFEAGVSNLIIDEPSTEKKPAKDKDKGKDKNKQPQELPVQQQWEQLRAEYPLVAFPPSLQLKYARLYAENQDFVGYLSAQGVNLNLPVVQAADDETYLKRNFYGKATKYGCPFVTHLNNIASLDMNTVIFGHHMNDGTVFGALDKYKTVDGFRSAPVLTFNTLYNDYKWKVIAAFITNAEEKEDNGYVFKYYFTNLSTEERYAAYLNELARRSLYDTGVDVLPSDKLLTLSTCSHEFNEARLVVVARLVRQGESEEVDVTRAVENSSPRFPQAYYDKKKQSNPYRDAARWEVG